MAASRGNSALGLTSRITVRSRSTWRISVGPAVILISAKEATGRMAPVRVTTGRWPMPWVEVIWPSGPASIRSIRRPSTVTSATRRPSLKASTVSPSSCAVTPLSANNTGFGTILISGAPSSKPGCGRNWLPSFRGNDFPIRRAAFRATSSTTSRSGPETFKLMLRPPPMPRPNNERLEMKP